jgi:hypothetical protein
MSQVHGQQEQDGQYEDGGDDQLRAGAGVMVYVVPRGAACRAPALDHRPGTLGADQVLAAHRNSFRPACDLTTPALAAL